MAVCLKMKVIKIARKPKVESEQKWFRTPAKPTDVRPLTRDKQEFAKKMRDSPTTTERIMLNLLVEHEIKFKTQVVMLGYIVDFYFKHAKAILEVDGASHREQKKYDNIRDEAFRQAGFRVLRIASFRLFKEPLAVIEEVKAYLKRGRAKKRVAKNVRAKRAKGKASRWQDVPKLSKNHLPTKRI